MAGLQDHAALVVLINWSDVWGRRLVRHRLLSPSSSVPAVAGEVCGIHAQMLPAAELSLGLRVAGLTRSGVRAALWDSRELVKTYGLRGTIHLFPAAELSFWRAALSAYANPGLDRQLAAVGYTPALAAEVVTAIGASLSAAPVTRAELGDRVVSVMGEWAAEEVFPAFGGMWPRWQPLLADAANAGVLCFGPNQGSRVTFVSPAAYLGDPGGVPADPVAEVARRYLHAYGPAAPAWFAEWFLITPAQAQEVFDRLDLERVSIEGVPAYQLAGDAFGDEADSVLLLPHFDCYPRGAHPRDAFVGPAPDGRRRQDLTGPLPLLVVDGVVAGVWERVKRQLRVQPFSPLPRSRRPALEAAAHRVGEILETSCELVIGEVGARPHA